MHLSPVLKDKSLSVAMFVIFSKSEQSQETEEKKHL